jgi:Rad3-related DNA helicase
MSLYDIKNETTYLASVIEEAEGEVGPELLERVSELQGTAREKIAGLARYATNLKSDAQAAKDEAKRLQDLAKARQNKYESVKAYLRWAVNEFEGGKYKDDAFSLSVGNAGGAAALVITGEVPQTYQEQTWTVDKTAIKVAIADGEVLDFAHYAERKQVLRGV